MRYVAPLNYLTVVVVEIGHCRLDASMGSNSCTETAHHQARDDVKNMGGS